MLYQLSYEGHLYNLHNFSKKFVFTLILLQQVRISNAASSLMTPLLVQRRPLCSTSFWLHDVLFCKTFEHLNWWQFLQHVHSKLEKPFEIKYFCVRNGFHISCIFPCCMLSIERFYSCHIPANPFVSLEYILIVV